MSPILIPTIWFLVNCTLAWPLFVLTERAKTDYSGNVLAWFIPTIVWCFMAAICLSRLGETQAPNWDAFWFWTVLYVGVEIVNVSALLIGVPGTKEEESDPRAA